MPSWLLFQQFFKIHLCYYFFKRHAHIPLYIIDVTEGSDFEWRIVKKVALSYVQSPRFPIASVSCPLSQKISRWHKSLNRLFGFKLSKCSFLDDNQLYWFYSVKYLYKTVEKRVTYILTMHLTYRLFTFNFMEKSLS